MAAPSEAPNEVRGEGWWEILELNQLPDFLRRCGTESCDSPPSPDTPASTPDSDPFSQLAEITRLWPKVDAELRGVVVAMLKAGGNSTEASSPALSAR
jgi:hypothetical protein